MFNKSELVQQTIVGSMALTASVSILMLIGSFNAYASSTIHRGVASIQGSTLVLNHSSEVPTCEQLKAIGVEYIESNDTEEITVEELCEA